MRVKNNVLLLIIIFVLSLLNLVVTYIIKYDVNSLPLSEFDLINFGNLLPLFFEIIIIIILSVYYIMNIELTQTQRGFLSSLMVVSSLMYLGVLLIYKLNISFPEEIIINYPFKKVFIGTILFSGLFIQLYVAILLIRLIIDKSNITYIKSIFSSIFILVIVLIFSFIYSASGRFDSNGVNVEKENIGVVLGAAVWSNDEPSPLFKGRIEKANQLYSVGKISKIQLTGGNAPGEISEAQAAYNYAIDLGVDDTDIFIEEKTSTTTEQIIFIKNKLSVDHNYDKILLISDQFHLTRILEICKFFNVDAIGVSSSYKLNWEKLLYYRIRESIALLFFWFFAI